MKKYIDIENDTIISESELKIEFEELKKEYPNEYNYSFNDYLKNCTSKNGSLKELKKVVDNI